MGVVERGLYGRRGKLFGIREADLLRKEADGYGAEMVQREKAIYA